VIALLRSAPVEIKVGTYDDRDFRVRFYLDAATLFLVEEAIRGDAKIAQTDGEDEAWSTFETIEGGAWLGLAVNYGTADFRVRVGEVESNRPYVEFSGEVWGEGDDAFDHTSAPKEIGLSERLRVAAVARRVFGRIGS
jgi:hypothetical protein